MQIYGAIILVTDGYGLIGSITIEILLHDYSPKRTVVLDELEQTRKGPRIELVRRDIRYVGLVKALISGMGAVIHMATLLISAYAKVACAQFGSRVRTAST